MSTKTASLQPMVRQFKTSACYPASGRPVQFLNAREAVLRMRDKYDGWAKSVMESADPLKYKPLLMEPQKINHVAQLLLDTSAVGASKAFFTFMVCLEAGLHLKIYEAINQVEKRDDVSQFTATLGNFFRHKTDGLSSAIEQWSDTFRYRTAPSIRLSISLGNHQNERDVDSFRHLVDSLKPQVIINENCIGRFTESFVFANGAAIAGNNPEYDRGLDDVIAKRNIKTIELEQMPPDEQAAYFETMPMQAIMPRKVRELISEHKIDEAFELNCRIYDSHWSAFTFRHKAFASNFREFLETLPLFCPELNGRDRISILARYGSMHRGLMGRIHAACPEIGIDEFLDSSALGFSVCYPQAGRGNVTSEKAYLSSFIGSFPISSEDTRLALIKLILFSNSVSLDMLKRCAEKEDIYGEVNRLIDDLVTQNGINPDNADECLRKMAAGYPEIIEWLDACYTAGQSAPEIKPAPPATKSAPAKIASFRKRMGQFKVDARSGYSPRLMLIKYNEEGLSEDEVSGSLLSLGFELIKGNWVRTKERG